MNEVVRLLTAILEYPESPSAQEPPEILVRQLPENWSSRIPFPEESSIVASAVQRFSFLHSYVLFETFLSAQQVTEFYEQQLDQLGWQPMDLRKFARRGFAPATLLHHFVYTEEGQVLGQKLEIKTKSVSENTTEVLLIVHSGVAARALLEDIQPNFSEGTVPLLIHPPGAYEGSESSSSRVERGQMTVNMIIEANLGLLDLTRHYTEQLRQAGWQSVEQDQQNSLFWSTWQFRNEHESWNGIFTILQFPTDPQHYCLQVSYIHN